jgi:hypothetical protein
MQAGICAAERWEVVGGKRTKDDASMMDGWMDDMMIDDDIKKKFMRVLMVGHVHDARSAQSLQLRESDPTFWILNAALGIRVASPISFA